MFKKIISKTADVIILFAYFYAIAMFIVILFHSVNYWSATFKTVQGVSAKMFWVGLIIAIIYSIMGFAEMFIRGFAQTFRSLFRREVKQ